MSMAKRHALVTGAGSGIGRAIALALAANGHGVSLCGRRAAPLEAVSKLRDGWEPSPEDFARLRDANVAQ